MTLDDYARRELLATFQHELEEHCQALVRACLDLEKEPEPAEQQRLLDQAFRSAHSLKGAARAVAAARVEALAHGLEGVLGAAKRGDIALTPPLFDLLYAAVDALSAEAVSTSEPPSRLDPETEALLRQLTAAETAQAEQFTGQTLPLAPTPPASPVLPASPALPASPVLPALPSPDTVTAAALPPPEARLPAPQPTPRFGEGTRSIGGARSGGETVRLPAARLDAVLEQLGEIVVPRLAVEEATHLLLDMRRRVDDWQRDWRRTRLRLRHLEREGRFEGLGALGRFLEQNAAQLELLTADLGVLDRRLAGSQAQLGTLTQDLQSEVKRLRLLPFETVTGSLERTVRDLARSLDKEARLVVIGAETELDRRVLEEIKDPLLHLVRNALDHGIEAPDERRRRGKPSIGSVIVTASQQGSTVVVEVEDDGAGLHPGTIRRLAVERGLVTEMQAGDLAEEEAVRLIFLPGFTSKEEVGQVSGRGVGLDVVARNVERLGGRVDVEATPGRGARFVMTLPLTLATTRAILVEVAGAPYALPTGAVERILRPARLGSLGGHLTLEYEGAAIPVAALADLLQAREVLPPANVTASPTLALVAAGAQRVAVVVDRVVGEQDIAVKPLGYPLVRVRGVAGATILGSGQVVPILNPADLVRAARARKMPAVAPPPVLKLRRRRVLIADDSLTTRTLERYILEAAGYEVEVAGDGLEAFALLQERGCDVLVSDVDMPRLDGIGLAARVRQDPNFRDLPIILVTSLDSDADRERGLQAGASAYIVKGTFDQDHLLRTLREFI